MATRAGHPSGVWRRRFYQAYYKQATAAAFDASDPSQFSDVMLGFGQGRLVPALKSIVPLGLCLLVYLWLAAGLQAQQTAIGEDRLGFRAVDLFIDSGSTPLAAYQLTFAATNGNVCIVGIEGGGHPAFRQPPFYDPKAIQQERVVLAGFSTTNAANLPSGKTRVATIHLQVRGAVKPQFAMKLQTACDAQGNKITVAASFEERKMP